MSVRQELADAAAAVPGIRAFPYYVQSLKTGTAYVRLDRIEWPDKFGSVTYWDLVVIAPSDLGKADQYIEEVVPVLHAALSPHLVITQVLPQQLQVDGGTLPCVFIRGFRKE